MSVAKSLANRWIDMGLLFNEANYSAREGFKLFWGRVSQPCKEKPPYKKLTHKPFFTFSFLNKNKGQSPLSPALTLSAPRGL